MKWLIRLWEFWFPPAPPEPAAPPPVKEAPRYRPNDYNIDAQGVMRRGSLTPGEGQRIETPPVPRGDARWTTRPYEPADPYPMDHVPPVTPTDELIVANLFADAAELLILRQADERLVAFMALQADAAPVIARALARAGELKGVSGITVEAS